MDDLNRVKHENGSNKNSPGDICLFYLKDRKRQTKTYLVGKRLISYDTLVGKLASNLGVVYPKCNIHILPYFAQNIKEDVATVSSIKSIRLFKTSLGKTQFCNQ